MDINLPYNGNYLNQIVQMKVKSIKNVVEKGCK